ncbi:hypothetical protein E4T48_04318 [Aureobasidium sp. EXF-10727]|nr:hypothetical protein E4T48_04318 [Aureobasidium sp. EXF-10727]
MHFSSSLVAAALAVGANAAQYKRQDYGNFNQTSTAPSFSYAPLSSSSSSVVAPINTAGSSSVEASSVAIPLSTGAYESSAAAVETSAAASSVVAPLSTGVSAYPSINTNAAFGTGAYGSGVTSAPAAGATGSEIVTAYTTFTTDVTLTYTIGGGSTKSVVTTTIHKTSTAYQTQTVYATPAASGSASDAAAESDSTSTTTLSTTSTTTNTVTVSPTSTGSYLSFWGEKAAVTGYGSSYGAPGTGASTTEAGCAPASTVTVTANETVYITVDSALSTIAQSTATGASVVPKQSSAAPYYPTTSGAASSSSCASTGFITIHKPSGASGAAYPTAY